jgi:hypothetical protein
MISGRKNSMKSLPLLETGLNSRLPSPHKDPPALVEKQAHAITYLRQKRFSTMIQGLWNVLKREDSLHCSR